MVGFSFNEIRESSFLFEHLKQMSKSGIESPHSHGWGMAIKYNDKEIIFHKSINPIYNEKRINIEGYIGIMHSRKASPKLEKTFLQLHPYFIKDTFFCHNGTIYMDQINNVFGTDSFEYFKYINDFSNEDELKRKIKLFSEKNKYTGINFLMIKNDKLYAFCKYKKEKEYYTMWYSEKNGVIISSEKLDDSFQPFENGMFLIAFNGEIIKKCN
ncbi:class II glutamine amidotransferase [Marinitoga hydrogenitolerans]|nr:class II glutamine amidotransferase [Marinitoga hydrogenitolerans]